MTSPAHKTGPHQGLLVFREQLRTSADAAASLVRPCFERVGREVGDTVAQMTQLAIEYDPQPPYDSGSPEKAGNTLTTATRSALSARGAGLHAPLQLLEAPLVDGSERLDRAHRLPPFSPDR